MRPQQAALFRALFGFFLLGGGASGCLLFTETFNRPPTVTITGPSTLFRQQPGEFVAAVEDDDRKGMKFAWARATSCPVDLEAAGRMVSAAGRMPAPPLDPTRLSLSEKEVGDFCVVALVTDKEGAQGFASKPLAIKARQLEITGPASAQANQVVSFAATFVDRPESVTKGQFAWALATGANACDAAKTEVTALVATDNQATLTKASPRRRFCVAVKAIDEFGATTIASLPVMVDFMPEIRMVQPTADTSEIGLYTSIRLSALDAEDDVSIANTQQYDWSLTAPDGRKFIPAELACGTAKNFEVCFEATLAGTYRAELVVTEDGTAKTAPPRDLVVADRPPCIAVTEPSFVTSQRLRQDFDKPRSFRVQRVEDDADPQPAGARETLGEFIWWHRKVASPPVAFERKRGSSSSFLLEERAYRPLDEVEIRVEYLDRIDQVAPGRPAYMSRCLDRNQEKCELVESSGCYRWVTWRVVYQ